MNLHLNRIDEQDRASLNFDLQKLVIAGWTGRNLEAMEAHIRELEEMGIPRPKQTPAYYECAKSLVTTDAAIEVVGEHTSGEVECFIAAEGDDIVVGLGSDHTDREVEKSGVTLSKQLCAKPICKDVWSFQDVYKHWDKLILRSWAISGDSRDLYQEGPVTTMRDPLELAEGYFGKPRLKNGTLMFCGTLAVVGTIRPAEAFEMELEDPVLGRRLQHKYAIEVLPIE